MPVGQAGSLGHIHVGPGITREKQNQAALIRRVARVFA
jgi:hypothetical protein